MRLAALVLLSACTASLDLDRFKRAAVVVETPNAAAPFLDLTFTCTGMTPHLGQYFELRIVDSEDRVQAKVIYNSLLRTDFSFDLPRIIPKSKPPYRLDYWSDQTRSFTYDGNVGPSIDKDHGWRRILQDPSLFVGVPVRDRDLPGDVVPFDNGKYELLFPHDTDFQDLFENEANQPVSFADEFLPFSMTLAVPPPFRGKTIEVHVATNETKRLVAVHRKSGATDTYTPQVTGVIDQLTAYEVSIWVDEDGNDRYSPGDPSWRTVLTSNDQGILDVVDLGTLAQTALTPP